MVLFEIEFGCNLYSVFIPKCSLFFQNLNPCSAGLLNYYRFCLCCNLIMLLFHPVYLIIFPEFVYSYLEFLNRFHC